MKLWGSRKLNASATNWTSLSPSQQQGTSTTAIWQQFTIVHLNEEKIDSSGVSSLVYTENASKCPQGGIKTIGDEGKPVHCIQHDITKITTDASFVCLTFMLQNVLKMLRLTLCFLPIIIIAKTVNGLKTRHLENILENILLKLLPKDSLAANTKQSLRRTRATRPFQSRL